MALEFTFEVPTNAAVHSFRVWQDLQTPETCFSTHTVEITACQVPNNYEGITHLCDATTGLVEDGHFKHRCFIERTMVASEPTVMTMICQVDSGSGTIPGTTHMKFTHDFNNDTPQAISFDYDLYTDGFATRHQPVQVVNGQNPLYTMQVCVMSAATQSIRFQYPGIFLDTEERPYLGSVVPILTDQSVVEVEEVQLIYNDYAIFALNVQAARPYIINLAYTLRATSGHAMAREPVVHFWVVMPYDYITSDIPTHLEVVIIHEPITYEYIYNDGYTPSLIKDGSGEWFHLKLDPVVHPAYGLQPFIKGDRIYFIPTIPVDTTITCMVTTTVNTFTVTMSHESEPQTHATPGLHEDNENGRIDQIDITCLYSFNTPQYELPFTHHEYEGLTVNIELIHNFRSFQQRSGYHLVGMFPSFDVPSSYVGDPMRIGFKAGHPTVIYMVITSIPDEPLMNESIYLDVSHAMVVGCYSPFQITTTHGKTSYNYNPLDILSSEVMSPDLTRYEITITDNNIVMECVINTQMIAAQVTLQALHHKKGSQSAFYRDLQTAPVTTTINQNVRQAPTYMDEYGKGIIITPGDVVSIELAMEFGTGTFLLPSDHVVLYGDVFDIIHTMRCTGQFSQSDELSQCGYDSLLEKQHTHSRFTKFMACTIPYGGQAGHQQPQQPQQPANTLGNGETSTPHVLLSPATFTLRCEVVFARVLTNEGQQKGVSEAPPSSSSSSSSGGYNNEFQLFYEVFADQTNKPVAEQYDNLNQDLFTFDHQTLRPPRVITVQENAYWDCSITASQDGAQPLLVDCDDLPSTCPEYTSASSKCGKHCHVSTVCMVDEAIAASEEVCIQQGLPRPHALSDISEFCPSCDNALGMYGPDCNTPPRFTSARVGRINRVPMGSILHRLSARSRRNSINTSTHHMESKHIVDVHSRSLASEQLVSAQQDHEPEHELEYDVDIYGNDEITLFWSYTGSPTAMVDVYLYSTTNFVQQQQEHRLHIASVLGSKLQYTFTFDSIAALHGHTSGLQDVQFDIVLGNTTPQEYPPLSIPKSLVYLQLAPFCQARPGHRDSFEEEHEDGGRIVHRCTDRGVCNISTGSCTCVNGSRDRLCARPSEITPCMKLQCVLENTQFHPITQHGECKHDESNGDVVVCNCKDRYTGHQCQHERVCEHRTCINGRLISPSNRPDECTCQCSNAFIIGTSCNQCILGCRNGGTSDSQCTACSCRPGYTGVFCQIPVWYHTYTLRTLPRHIVEMILDESSSTPNQQLGAIRETMIKLLLVDYSSALRDMYIVIDRHDRSDGMMIMTKMTKPTICDNTTYVGGISSLQKNILIDTRIPVHAELVSFQTVIPPSGEDPFIRITLMVFPVDMTDEMLLYAEQQGLEFDWSHITSNLNLFTTFLEEHGIETKDEAGWEPEIDDIACISRRCQESKKSEESSNDGEHPSLVATWLCILVVITLALVRPID